MPDLVTANYWDDTVSVLLNNGNGTFAATMAYPTGAAPDSVAAADFNGDGKTDLAVANRSDNTVSILLGTPVQHQASVGVTSGVNPSTYGQTLTLTAAVSAMAPANGTPTGTVIFYDGAMPLSAPVALANGIATFTTSGLSVATHTITAVYSGDTYFNGNTGAMFQTVTASQGPIVTMNPAGATTDAGLATAVTFTAAASGIPAPTARWQVNTGSGFIDMSNGGVYNGVTSPTLTVTGATLAMNGYQYRAVFTNGTAPDARPHPQR